jgi:DNA mismatch repair ATPase MutS
MESEDIREKYIRDAAHYRKIEADEERLLLILSLLRLASFAGGLVLIWLGFMKSVPAGILLLIIAAGLFLYLLKLFAVHSERKSFLHNLSKIMQNEADAFNDFSIFEDGSSYIDLHHEFSADVDLYGSNSLFQYLNRTVTSYGRDILAGWLSSPYSLAGRLTDRQEAIKELALKEEWRHSFMASGMDKPFEKSQIVSLTDWMNEKAEINPGVLKRIFVYFLPLTSVASLILVASGLLHYSVFISIFILNLLVVAAGLKKTNRIHRVLSGKHNYLSSIHQLIKIFEVEGFDSVILNNISQKISGSTPSAAAAIRKLEKLIEGFDSRLNIIIGFILNGLLLWDYQCISRLESWKSEYRDIFPGWLEMLGEVDAYISLGNYARNNPGFAYPVLSQNGTLFSALSLGHPLIIEKKRVCNDFDIGRRGNVCIISGANMSGKSTFLRTVAVNYIIGSAGGPVCASAMTFTPMKLFTSMRTTDSLSGNESYFYAELKRLKLLKVQIERREPVLFILDEILKGTNSADKSLGSRLFIKRIIDLGGTGLIATHDTSLGEMESEYPGKVLNKCFEIEIEGESIRFDYKLQNGITRKMNASILMKQMGIIE